MMSSFATSTNKKFILGSLIALLLAGFFIYFAIIPRTYKAEVAIAFPMLKTGEQLNKAGNIAKWYIPFANSDTTAKVLPVNTPVNIAMGDHSLDVRQPTLTTAIYESSYRKQLKQFLFRALPVESDPGSCKVSLTYKSSVFANWLDKGQLRKNARLSLENLKGYMEDTRRFYGYAIAQTTVEDTSFLFLSTTVPVVQKKAATKDLFDKLIMYAKQKDAGYTGTRIFYALPVEEGQLKLFASIVITNNIRTVPTEPIQFKRMPFGKNLLVADYHGLYGEVSKAYTALENFKADHNHTSMAIPYQKFLDPGYDFSDSQLVRMKVYYPIY